MRDILTVTAALLCGAAVLLWTSAWLMVFPVIGLLWLVGWLA